MRYYGLRMRKRKERACAYVTVRTRFVSLKGLPALLNSILHHFKSLLFDPLAYTTTRTAADEKNARTPARDPRDKFTDRLRSETDERRYVMVSW